MKLESQYVLFAETVLRDESKKLSIINLFDMVVATSVPSIQNRLVIVFGLSISNSNDNAKTVHLYGYKPDGTQFIDTLLPSNFGEESGDGQFVADLSGMPIESYGDYTFSLSYEDEKIPIASRKLKILTPQEK